MPQMGTPRAEVHQAANFAEGSKKKTENQIVLKNCHTTHDGHKGLLCSRPTNDTERKETMHTTET